MEMSQTYSCFIKHGAKRRIKSQLDAVPSTVCSRVGRAAWDFTKRAPIRSARFVLNYDPRSMQQKSLGNVFNSSFTLQPTCTQRLLLSVYAGASCFDIEPGLSVTCCCLWHTPSALHAAVQGQRDLLVDTRVFEKPRRPHSCHSWQLW